MYDIAVQSWLKKYLMEKKETDFYEVRYFRSHGLINRQDTNIAGYHLTGGEFDCENELKAIYEYIERLACRKVPDEEIRMADPRDAKILSFEELGFAWTGSSFEPLKEQIRYVEGIGLKHNTKYLVPSVFAYYLDNSFDEWKLFAGNSNGNALGQGMEDALERAVLEFVERDKFIKYWYQRDGQLLKIPEEIMDTAMKRKMAYFRSRGYQTDFFCIRNKPEEIFAVWCLLRSFDRGNPMFSLTSLGADMNLIRAMEKAHEEVSGMYFSRLRNGEAIYEGHKEAGDPKQFRMEDSLAYYFSYEREAEFHQLLEGVETWEPPSWGQQGQSALLETALHVYEDVLCIPIKGSILTDLGLQEVKAVGLGGNNMYFGNHKQMTAQGRIPGPCPFA